MNMNMNINKYISYPKLNYKLYILIQNLFFMYNEIQFLKFYI